jgi:hypothetical protein
MFLDNSVYLILATFNFYKFICFSFFFNKPLLTNLGAPTGDISYSLQNFIE